MITDTLHNKVESQREDEHQSERSPSRVNVIYYNNLVLICVASVADCDDLMV